MSNDTTRAAPQEPVAHPSPTAGMNIAQRILHVGGRNNEAGYVEFGSIQAVEALIRQVLRDMPAAPARAEPTDAEIDALMPNPTKLFEDDNNIVLGYTPKQIREVARAVLALRDGGAA